jgi:hypothetical protein
VLTVGALPSVALLFGALLTGVVFASTAAGAALFVCALSADVCTAGALF